MKLKRKNYFHIKLVKIQNSENFEFCELDLDF